MYVVIKRDGRQVQFDASKIEIAILKAMRYGSGIVNEELAKKIAEDFTTDKMIVTIKEISNAIIIIEFILAPNIIIIIGPKATLGKLLIIVK